MRDYLQFQMGTDIEEYWGGGQGLDQTTPDGALDNLELGTKSLLGFCFLLILQIFQDLGTNVMDILQRRKRGSGRLSSLSKGTQLETEEPKLKSKQVTMLWLPLCGL